MRILYFDRRILYFDRNACKFIRHLKIRHTTRKISREIFYPSLQWRVYVLVIFISIYFYVLVGFVPNKTIIVEQFGTDVHLIWRRMACMYTHYRMHSFQERFQWPLNPVKNASLQDANLQSSMEPSQKRMRACESDCTVRIITLYFEYFRVCQVQHSFLASPVYRVEYYAGWPSSNCLVCQILSPNP